MRKNISFNDCDIGTNMEQIVYLRQLMTEDGVLIAGNQWQWQLFLVVDTRCSHDEIDKVKCLVLVFLVSFPRSSARKPSSALF